MLAIAGVACNVAHMGKAACYAVLMGLFGFAATALANVTPVGATPANDPGGWITSNDYPAAALRARIGGITGFKVTIDASGVVSACEIVLSSGSPDLDAATCALVTQRARFNPATDAEDRPTGSSYRSSVHWVVPSTVPAPVGGARFANDPREWVTADDYPKEALRAGLQGTATYRAEIDTVGNVSSCSIVLSTGSKVLDDATCTSVIKRARFMPATDPAGHPTTGTYTGRFTWIIPDTVYRAPHAGTSVERMIIEANGKPSHCQAAGAEVGGKQLVYAPCSQVVYQPYRNGTGQPVRKQVTITSVTTITDLPN